MLAEVEFSANGQLGASRARVPATRLVDWSSFHQTLYEKSNVLFMEQWTKPLDPNVLWLTRLLMSQMTEMKDKSMLVFGSPQRSYFHWAVSRLYVLSSVSASINWCRSSCDLEGFILTFIFYFLLLSIFGICEACRCWLKVKCIESVSAACNAHMPRRDSRREPAQVLSEPDTLTVMMTPISTRHFF